MARRILIVDDDPDEGDRLAEIVSAVGHVARIATSGAEALEIAADDPALAAIILDLVMPDTDGFGVLAGLKKLGRNLPVIVVTATEDEHLIGSVLKAGAMDYVTRPVAFARLETTLANVLRLARLADVQASGPAKIASTAFSVLDPDIPQNSSPAISSSPVMSQLIVRARRAVKSCHPVLIEGEPGTGKTALAFEIARNGPRAARPVHIMACQGWLEDAESALFGGSNAPGLLTKAQGGTLILDEIGDLPLRVQARLEQVLSGKQPLQDAHGRQRRADITLIATTRTRLVHLTGAGLFNAALHDRLNIQPLYLPPLRHRPEDQDNLADTICAHQTATTGRAPVRCHPDTIDLFRSHSWPGNLRELKKVLGHALASTSGPVLVPADFPGLAMDPEASPAPYAPTGGQPLATSPGGAHQPPVSVPLSNRFCHPDGRLKSMLEVERDLIAFALLQNARSISKAARALGIGRSTLYRKLHIYGLLPVAAPKAA